MIFKEPRHTKDSCYFKGVRKERKGVSTASARSPASESLWTARKVSSKLWPVLLPSEKNVTVTGSDSASRGAGNTSPQDLPEEDKELVVRVG